MNGFQHLLNALLLMLYMSPVAIIFLLLIFFKKIYRLQIHIAWRAGIVAACLAVAGLGAWRAVWFLMEIIRTMHF